jgi:hypothetical protein
VGMARKTRCVAMERGADDCRRAQGWSGRPVQSQRKIVQRERRADEVIVKTLISKPLICAVRSINLLTSKAEAEDLPWASASTRSCPDNDESDPAAALTSLGLPPRASSWFHLLAPPRPTLETFICGRARPRIAAIWAGFWAARAICVGSMAMSGL